MSDIPNINTTDEEAGLRWFLDGTCRKRIIYWTKEDRTPDIQYTVNKYT